MSRWPDEVEEMLQQSNKVAVALTDANLPPSNKNTAALIVLAAANSQHLRSPPLTREEFLVLCGSLWNIVEGCDWGKAPLRSEPTS